TSSDARRVFCASVEPALSTTWAVGQCASTELAIIAPYVHSIAMEAARAVTWDGFCGEVTVRSREPARGATLGVGFRAGQRSRRPMRWPGPRRWRWAALRPPAQHLRHGTEGCHARNFNDGPGRCRRE